MKDVKCPYCEGDNVVEVYEDERWYCLDCECYFDVDEVIEEYMEEVKKRKNEVR